MNSHIQALFVATLLCFGCDRSERIPVTIHNEDGTVTETFTTQAEIEKEERIRNERYHQINIVVHGDGSLQKQGHQNISDSEFIEMMKEETKKEKMVTFVTDQNVSVDRYLELNKLVHENGIETIRMLNKESMVEPGSAYNSGQSLRD